FGPPQGEKPDQVSGFEILGRTDEGRRISFRWNPSKNATGYLLRWGTEPDELYSSCEVFASTKELGLFSAGQKYYFRIDAFGEGGVTQGKEVLVSE
ncbi:MAG: 1,4-beta-xylanase, partial [Bacteroidales bacterium]|nr:1,4-beta-xylanase [Bacteroidales bacterium]